MAQVSQHASASARRLPVGAELRPGGVDFRVWAPAVREVVVELDGHRRRQLSPEPGGYFSALVEHISAGAPYRFRLDRSETLLPDPAARFQPDGPHGASEVIDPGAFAWT